MTAAIECACNIGSTISTQPDVRLHPTNTKDTTADDGGSCSEPGKARSPVWALFGFVAVTDSKPGTGCADTSLTYNVLCIHL